MEIQKYNNFGEIRHAFRENADNSSVPNVEDIRYILENSVTKHTFGKAAIDTIASINWGMDSQEISDAVRRELDIKHGDVQNEVFTHVPEDKDAFIELGSAAFWTARLSGASWLESIDASRWAQEETYGVSAPHRDIMNNYIEQHGMKEIPTAK